MENNIWYDREVLKIFKISLFFKLYKVMIKWYNLIVEDRIINDFMYAIDMEVYLWRSLS